MEGASSSFPGGGGTSSGGGGSLVILSVSIVGILSTALLLLACYLFLTRCGLLFFWRWRADADQSSSISVVGALHNQEPPRRSRGGLEEAAIRRIPTFRYHQAHLVVVECAVCLGDFCDGERLRLLPPCRHAFHIDCIDAWLHATGSCPLCRAPVVVAADDHPAAAIVGLPRATDGDIVIDITAADEAAAAAAAAEQPPSNDRSRLLMPLRRSLSMDSSTDKQRFYLALHRIIQQQQQEAAAGGKEQGESAAADRSSRRLRRSFFSFSQSRGSRTAILPL